MRSNEPTPAATPQDDVHTTGHAPGAPPSAAESNIDFSRVLELGDTMLFGSVSRRQLDLAAEYGTESGESANPRPGE